MNNSAPKVTINEWSVKNSVSVFFFLDFDALEDEIRPFLDEVSRILRVRRSFSRKQEVACFVVSCSVQSPGLLLVFFSSSAFLFSEK